MLPDHRADRDNTLNVQDVDAHNEVFWRTVFLVKEYRWNLLPIQSRTL
jgi:hypothetical protein